MKVDDLSSSEYNPYYAAYVDMVDDITLIDGLKRGLNETISFLKVSPRIS